MGPTIRDVAQAAGVSIATVSRGLAGSSTVAAATRERVHRAATELGYRPNRAAREQETGRRRSIALVLPDLQNPFYAAVAKGVQRRVGAAGLTAIVTDTDEDPVREQEVLGELRAVADRFILASPRSTDAHLREFAGESAVVLVNRELTGIAGVVGDNQDGVRQVLAHLRALGHRRIGYAGGPRASWSDAQRRAGLEAARPPEVEVVDLGAFRPGSAGGVAAADEVLAAQVSAVVAFNDQLALGILGRLHDRGVAVPQQMSVTGFDDVPVARLLAPALTTVAVPMLQMGERAAGLLIEPGDQEAQRVRLPVHLQVRSSTMPPAR